MRLRVCLTLSSILLLAACSGVREDLGLAVRHPMNSPWSDRPPLSMPPDFDLRPPRPGCRASAGCRYQRASGQEPLPVGRSAAAALSSASGSEKALLAQTGGDKADTGIRDTVNHETSQKVAANDHLVRELLDWGAWRGRETRCYRRCRRRSLAYQGSKG